MLLRPTLEQQRLSVLPSQPAPTLPAPGALPSSHPTPPPIPVPSGPHPSHLPAIYGKPSGQLPGAIAPGEKPPISPS